jgi:hypothetical protein
MRSRAKAVDIDARRFDVRRAITKNAGANLVIAARLLVGMIILNQREHR